MALINVLKFSSLFSRFILVAKYLSICFLTASLASLSKVESALNLKSTLSLFFSRSSSITLYLSKVRYFNRFLQISFRSASVFGLFNFSLSSITLSSLVKSKGLARMSLYKPAVSFKRFIYTSLMVKNDINSAP